MEVRQGKYGPFLGCTRFPQCKKTADLPSPPVAKRVTSEVIQVELAPVIHRDDPTQFKWRQLVIIVAAVIGATGTILTLAAGFGGCRKTADAPMAKPALDEKPLERPPPVVVKKAAVMTLEERQAYAKDLKKADYPVCPVCGKQMVLRKNRQTNEPFFGCSDFPRCRGTKNIVYSP